MGKTLYPTLGYVYIVGVLLLDLGIKWSPYRFSNMLCWATGLEGKGCYFLGPLCPEQLCGVMSVSKQQELAQSVSSACSYEVPPILNLSGLNVGKRHGRRLGLESTETLWNQTDLYLSPKRPKARRNISSIWEARFPRLLGPCFSEQDPKMELGPRQFN